MTLYLLRPRFENRELTPHENPWYLWYDKAFGHVVRAETEEQARSMAAHNAGDEGAKAWTNSAFSTCVPLTTDGPEEAIITSFHHA